jgi:hypothetical protein
VSLTEQQALFATLLARLILWVQAQPGMRVRLGWVYDPPDTGSTFRSSRSLHRHRLAADLILDLQEGLGGEWVYQTTTEAYAPLGRHWLTLDPLCEWGGSGDRGDGNHFSLRHGGRW